MIDSRFELLSSLCLLLSLVLFYFFSFLLLIGCFRPTYTRKDIFRYSSGFYFCVRACVFLCACACVIIAWVGVESARQLSLGVGKGGIWGGDIVCTFIGCNVISWVWRERRVGSSFERAGGDTGCIIGGVQIVFVDTNWKREN